MKKILIAITIIVCYTTSCTPQDKPNKQTKQQNAIDYLEDELVEKDVGTKSEELQGELQIALAYNDMEELTILLRKGADANQLPGNTDMTPLMLAETEEIAQLLIKNGANPLVVDAYGQNLLHYAVSKEHAVDLILLYASLGVDINARDQEDDTPISLAITYFIEAKAFEIHPFLSEGEYDPSKDRVFKPNPYKTLKTLVEAGAELNAFNKYGNTIMMNCVTRDNPHLVEILLELGADKNIQDKHGQTARDRAYDLGRRYIYQLLE